jgi:hypothetical protein
MELDKDIQKIKTGLESFFPEYLVFEHGASNLQSEPHGGCIIHAHLHLFPTAKETGSTLLAALPWSRLASLTDIVKADGSSYCLLRLADKYYLNKSVRLPSQWIRRVVVDSLNTNRHWDWGVDFGHEELDETLLKLRHLRI